MLYRLIGLRFFMQPDATHFTEGYDEDTGLYVVYITISRKSILEKSSAGGRILEEYHSKSSLSDKTRRLLVSIVVAEMMKVHG